MKRCLAIGLVVLLAACGEQATTPSAGAEAFDLPADQVMIGGRTQMFSDGIMTAELIADSAYNYDDGRPWDLVRVEVTFFNEMGAQAGKVTSDRGQYDLASSQFVALGNVVLVTEGAEGQRTLETEKLNYNSRDDELWTDVPFTLLEEGRTTTGTSFRSDSKFQTWEVSGATTQGTVSGDAGIRF